VNAKVLFVALEKTGEDKYREAIQDVMVRLDAQPEGALDLSAAYEPLPFRMAYEMKLNRMERVGQTAAMYCDVHKRLWKNKAQRHSDSLQEEGWFLMALMDGIECCSDQLYEHWRTLVDIYRESLSGVLCRMTPQGLLRTNVTDGQEDAGGTAIVLYALLMGVQMGLIDPERYLPVARKIFKALVDNKFREVDGKLSFCDCCFGAGLGPGDKRDGSVSYYLSETVGNDDCKAVGALMMAWAEYQKTEK
jgi:unsaturated rhamnogalacturonyl hydrolase